MGYEIVNRGCSRTVPASSMKIGDIGQIVADELGNDFEGEWIIGVYGERNTEFVSLTDPGNTWSWVPNLTVRLLQPGEEIIIRGKN